MEALQHDVNTVSGLYHLISLNTTISQFGHSPPPKDTRREGMTSARVWGHHHAVSISSRLPKPFNCSVSQTSWQALCSRKTRCLKLAAMVIVGSSHSSKPNRVTRQCKEKARGSLYNPTFVRNMWRHETGEVSLTRLRWREACWASSKLAPSEWSLVKDL